jgi:UDP-arabinose 4-epimerase
VGESVGAPERYYRNNVTGTLNLLEVMLRHRCRDIVLSSTCATYGVPTVVPIPEDHLQQPINPYGWSKLMAERILSDYGRAYGIRYFALRYFNAAGADPDGEIGESHTPETHLLPLAIEAALGSRPHVELFGTDYPTRDGTAIRDYIHVADLAEAHVRALGHLLGGHASTFLNVGTGNGQSVHEVVKAVEAVTHCVVPTRNAPRRPGDPPVLIADPTRARAVLAWQPRISDLETIVATAARWHASRQELSNAQLAST